MNIVQSFEEPRHRVSMHDGDDLHDEVERLAGDCAERYARLLPRVAARIVGPDPAAEKEALESGGFVLDDTTVVMRLNPDTDHLEFFCDIGMPLPHTRDDAYRAALEMNLCRSHPGVTFGVHPESSRLVATTAMHMLLVADDEACLNAIGMLTRISRELRANRTFIVED
ncbi:hypothetical protein WG922_09970 [Ramlibacter sp. AN1015]|uniref:hypothetical protein n=1 Tax=Ramlibacter sp. AN1015 TaxID=3133428 RepID=UPI0030BFEE79